MSLTTAQLQILKTAILAETAPDFVALRTANDELGMAAWYNVESTFIVFKSTVPSMLIGKTIAYVALAAMTDANRGRLTTFLQLNQESFIPNLDVQAYFNDTFSGALGGAGASTRAAMEALYRRAATRGEKIYATGTGTTVAPGALGWEGSITAQNISDALRS